MENKIDTVTDIDKDLVFEETLKYLVKKCQPKSG